MKDDKTKMLSAHICDNKGASDERVIEKVLEDIERLGYTDVIVKGDGEPALVQFVQALKDPRKHPKRIAWRRK